VRWSTLARLAMAGTKTDRVRVTMTAIGSVTAVFAWLCAATVASMGRLNSMDGSDSRYSSDVIAQPGLRPGVIATFVLLTIPVLGFVGQCARLGAPARDRRLGAMRLAGATPRQAIVIGAGESGIASLAGSVLGLVVFLVLRQILDHVDANGQRALPTDVRTSPIVIAIVCLLLPLVVSAISAVLLGSVTTTPLGIVARVRRAKGPSPLAGILILAGLGLFAVFAPVLDLLTRHHIVVPGWVSVVFFYVGVLLASIGVAVGAGWIAYTSGRLLRRFGRSPSSRLAAARLVADPWQGSRAFGVLLVAVLFGGAIAGTYANFATMQAIQDASQHAYNVAVHEPDDIMGSNSFYTDTTRLVGIAVGIAAIVGALGLLVSLTESIVSRRRTYAALVAGGVPRSVLARTQIWQTMSMALPALVLAAVVGLELARALFGATVSGGGEQYSQSDGLGDTVDQPVEMTPKIVLSVPVPWHELGIVLGGSTLAVLVTIGIGLLFLKPSTSIEELRTG
jgi:hypothetical protein